jgi:ATP-dependent DNA helicase RecQ
LALFDTGNSGALSAGHPSIDRKVEMFSMAEAKAALKKHWGHGQFRTDQKTVIENVRTGKDVLAVLPTGYGKSACFQIPAVLSEGSTLVISPLIALMKDQVDDCIERGIAATYVNSHVDEDEQEDRFNDFIAGCYKLFYVAPERIRSKMFISTLKQADIRYLVVDEAHCASMWGHDFRPMYSRIKTILDIIGDEHRPQVIAVTATATADIEEDIAESIGMKPDYKRLVGDPIRPNLRYKVEYGNEWSTMNMWARRFDPILGRYVVYVGTRNGAERVCQMIGAQIGEEYVGVYHAGLRKPDREKVQQAFKDGTLPVIVATCAFGMGIDVPNIRAVVHFGIPGSIEDYVQESGRAGRDGRYSDVVLIESTFSYELRQMFIDNANPPYAVFQMLWEWLHDVLEEGGTLHKSGDAIADAMRAAYEMDGRITGDMVRGALNIMEAHKLLAREYARSGIRLTVSLPKLEKVYGKVQTRIKNALKAHIADLMPSAKGSVAISLDRETFASSISVTPLSLTRALKKVEEQGAVQIGRVFRGKTTRIKKWGADLDEHLPKERIVKKRERELRRLAKMMEYVNTPDRVQFIRTYFEKGF